MSLNLTVTASIVGLITGAPDLVSVEASIAKKRIVQFLDGVGAGQANLMFADTRSIAASSNDDIDLAGALTDPLGEDASFARIKAILVVASANNTNDVVIGGAATNTFVGPFGASTHKVALPPGGVMLIAAPTAAGWPVTAATGDLLRIANSGAGSSVSYDLVIVGGDA
ncbi:hypothetical protein [Phenylobacterium sp.]|uniref:hypothetical protein n=1 Tax=Phenylobacterium sp. TaxID=1871053 RepID=UPI002735C698|nr:hypothetical protein [Phenylobacterium sp.]MDP3853622.1 hypothetical protein [Phenylobacterium sp.]